MYAHSIALLSCSFDTLPVMCSRKCDFSKSAISYSFIKSKLYGNLNCSLLSYTQMYLSYIDLDLELTNMT